MQNIIDYDFKFILNKKKFDIEVCDDYIFYIKFLDDDKTTVRWQNKDGNWDFISSYTKEDFDENVNDKYWLLVP